MDSSSAYETVGSDDVFANSSAETVVENVDFSLILKQGKELVHLESTDDINVQQNNIHRDSSICVEKLETVPENDKSSISNHIVSKVLNFPLKLYCPFCCSSYTSKTMFKGHMRDKHLNYLDILTVDNIDSYIPYACHYCHAQYNTIDILIKHITQTHQDIVIAELLLQEKLPHTNILCIFCPDEKLVESKQDLLAHIEKYHFMKLKTFLKVNSKHNVNITPESKNNSSVSVLNNLLLEMSINDIEETVVTNVGDRVLKSSLRTASPSSGKDKKQIRNVRFQLDVPTTKRKLNFDVHDGRDFISVSKENIISCSTNIRPLAKHPPKTTKAQTQAKWKSVFSFKRKHVPKSNMISKLVTSTPTTLKISQNDRTHEISRKPKPLKQTMKIPISHKTNNIMFGSNNKKNGPIRNLKKEDISSPLSPLLNYVKVKQSVTWTPPEESFQQYKCAICLQAFINNADLISHVHQRHTGPLKILQPLFKCGQCEAKFYKNSFLLRHCKFHHTPRCLKNKLIT
ncbi:hypothetical protein L9F63_007304 [Diploptera punctata]|uniref:C2H2-type domain-containing protein n=1 Tax=Diploptera punctata TaxID=6984 RepID=A0AAD8E3U2_DIPPU|nr:hypothetical protein L9F63_007304 [Diploptera punctata]